MSVDSALTRTGAITITPDRILPRNTHNFSWRCADLLVVHSGCSEGGPERRQCAATGRTVPPPSLPYRRDTARSKPPAFMTRTD